MTFPRLVAVLGYSDGARPELHPVCAARLARAEEEVAPEDVVLLSGRARKITRSSEAELMARAWHSPVRSLVLDHDARSTYGNIQSAATTARRLEAREVVLVTSAWHARRASVLLRASLRHQTPVRVAATAERGSAAARLRELACWALVPFQVLAARRSAYRALTMSSNERRASLDD